MIQEIYNKYGFEAMREVWIEELLELATILQRSKRHEISEDDIISEIADVSFCTDQMFYIFGHVKCSEVKMMKKKRTKERLL